MTEQKAIDSKYLKGLEFSFSKSKVKEVDGKKTRKYEAAKRTLRPEDVMSWKEKNGCVCFVTKDGKKYSVKK